MKEKIVSILMLALILTSTLSIAFIIRPSLAENGFPNENFMEKNRETGLPNQTNKPGQASILNNDWRNIFEKRLGAEQSENLESPSQTSRLSEDKWNFSDTSEWSNFTYIDGNKTRLIVGVNDENPTSLLELERIAAAHQAKIIDTVSIGGEVRAVVVELLLVSVTAFVEETRDVELASYIEPNMKVQAQFIPNDPYWSMQWGPQKIEADWAWNTTVGDPSVLVAVVDTGIYYTHEDLAANYVALGYDWVNNDNDPMDDHGHGTHCAGIIAAILNNSVGIAGLAQVRVMAEKVLDSGGGGGYYDWVANGIIHATDSGADIISMSLGGYGESELLHQAVKYAYDAGVLVIAAAGNDNTNMKFYPAGYDEVIAVAATDDYDNKAGFSNWGDWIELAAPGVSIYSTVPWGYESWSGTSMACPQVAGVAALVWSQYPNKTRDWMRLWLRYTANDLGDPGFDVYYGYGRVSARKAFEQSPPAHELIAYDWITPPYVEPGASGIINATILNFGENNETDVAVQLLANDTLVDSTSIGFLASGNSATVSLVWNPTVEGLCNVTLYVVPMPGETSVENNVVWKYIYVGSPVKAVVLHSAGNIQGNIITNWQALNSEWHLFGGTMVCIDYTTLNKEDITYEDIAATEADVLIISCAYDPYIGWQFTDSEIEAITQYAHEGHGLIATAGTLYYQVPNNNKLAPLFGLNETIMWTGTGTDLMHLLNATHPIFANVPNPLVFPQLTTSFPYDGRWDSNELVGGKYLALGHYQESAIVTYRGLVYISPWLEIIPPYYHHHLQLLYNAIIWSWYQKPEHELEVSLEVPKYLQPGESVLLNATVSNLGLNNETGVELMLLVDGAAVNSTTIPELVVEATYTLNYLWAPTVQKVYNVTAYAPALPDEELTLNNFAMKKVRVMLPIKVAVLGDYQSQLTNLLWENGIIAHERDWDIITDIYEYNAVVVNRPYDPGSSTFLAFIAAADEYGVGLVFTSSWPGSEAPYGISLLQWYLNDPEGQGNTYGQGSVYYEVVQEHPIFEDWNIGDKIYLITSGYGDHAWFWGYSGEVIGNIGDDNMGIRGGGIAYKIRQGGNKHLLLAGLAPQYYANTVHWTEEANLTFIRGVLWVVSKPEHELSVNLEIPEYQMPNHTVVLNATVRNRGLNNETNVELFLMLEGGIVNSTMISQLPVGVSQTINYLWTPTIEGIYNVTAYAPPVENETFIANNKATKFATVRHPLIHPIEGQYANYTMYYVDPSTGEEIYGGLWNFTYLHYISLYQINITTWMKDPYNFTQSGWMIVNIFTRIVERDSGIGWTGMWYPGWIKTNVTLGSSINLLWGNATIVDNKVIYINGRPIDCWETRLEYQGYVYTFWYDKASGLWIDMRSAGPYGVTYLILTTTNIPIGFMIEHDLAVTLDAPTRLSPGTSTLLNATVYNTGLSNETNVTLQLAINGSIVASEVIPELVSSDFHTLIYLWTPTMESLYNITAYAPPVSGENQTRNNVVSKMVRVGYAIALISDYSELSAITPVLDSIGISYDIYSGNNIHLYTEDLSLLLDYGLVIFYNDDRMITTDEHSSLEAYLSSGGNLIVTGYDSLGSPDDPLLADIVRSSSFGDNTGEPDLFVVDATHPIMNGPYGSFPLGYHIVGLFSDCDVAEADVTRNAVAVAELADGYDKIIATQTLLGGKVVFWNGEGVNDWTWNTDCQTMFKNMINWIVTRHEHDLAVSLEAPLFVVVEPNNSVQLNATVRNRGLNNETNVEFELLIDDTVVSSTVISELLIGASHTISYVWTPPMEGTYNITAYATPVLGEEFTANNKVTQFVSVFLVPVAGTCIFVNPPKRTLILGESFTVDINIFNVTNLAGWQVNITFDPTILNVQNIFLPAGHIFEGLDPVTAGKWINNMAGIVWWACAIGPDAPIDHFDGSGTMCRIEFATVGLGTSPIHIETQGNFPTKIVKPPPPLPIPFTPRDGAAEVLEYAIAPDIAIIEVTPSTTQTYAGRIVNITVVVKNEGNATQDFNVTAYYDSSPIERLLVTGLNPGANTSLTFNWNTTGLTPGQNYTISAEAHVVPGEIDTADNFLPDGIVEIKLLGDIDGDGIVNITDLVLIVAAIPSYPGHPSWNPQADLNGDNVVDIADIVIALGNFLKSCP